MPFSPAFAAALPLTSADVDKALFRQWMAQVEAGLDTEGLQTYTPTVVPTSGAFNTAPGSVTATGFYTKVGKLVFYAQRIIWSASGNGTAGGFIKSTLPFTPATDNLGQCRGMAVSGAIGYSLIVAADIYAYSLKNDNTYPAANGETLFVTGAYRST